MHRRDLVLLAVMFQFIAPATGLGSMTGDTVVAADPGERIAFDLYLFGDGNVTVAADGPRGWPSYADPSTVRLPPRGDARYTRTSEGYRRLAPVTVVTAVPPDTADGVYTVAAHVRQRPGTDGTVGTGFDVEQLRTVRYTVRVGDPTPTDRSRNTTTTGSVDDRSTSTGTDDGITVPWPLVILELAWIVVLASLLFRRR